MHVVFHGLAGGLLRRREHRPDVDVEPQVGERGRDDLLPAVMTVLSHLGDQNSRPPSLDPGDFIGEAVGLG